MWWNRFASVIIGVFLGFCSFDAAIAGRVCPVKRGTTLQYVTVFDGAPEELASLIPDQTSNRTGRWEVGYVYDAGREVTIRCRYLNGDAQDIRLTDRIGACFYAISRKHVLALSCK
ncbi:STY0301 family protein [Paraburkholderia acidisoli]|uniref:STY0301 family protein n=1 Tax=Paraburkholderia acidisoli TaxID=2571748 RepID=UPI002D80D5EE|nr:STY0301 family protein [Paraburkholderia acidisoli]